jgi:hypothetical protein
MSGRQQHHLFSLNGRRLFPPMPALDPVSMLFPVDNPWGVIISMLIEGGFL